MTTRAPLGRAQKWLLAAGIAAAVLVLLAIGLASLVPSDEELARRAATELEAALGVPVSVGALHWRLRPSALVELENAATQQSQPIVIKRLTANLNVSALWQRRLKLDRVEVDGAVLPQLSLRGLHAPSGKSAGASRAACKWMNCPWSSWFSATWPGFRATAPAWCSPGKRNLTPAGDRARPSYGGRISSPRPTCR